MAWVAVLLAFYSVGTGHSLLGGSSVLQRGNWVNEHGKGQVRSLLMGSLSIEHRGSDGTHIARGKVTILDLLANLSLVLSKEALD